MPLTLSTPQTPSDFLRMAEIRGLAFGSNYEYIDLLFPNFTTPSGQNLLAQRLQKMPSTLPSTRFAIIRDTETNEIISQGEWHFYEAEEKGDIMDLDFLEGTEEQREYGRYLISTFQAKRREAIAGTKVPLLLLDSLATDPKYQRRGAGSMLVKWGLDMADTCGGEAYLEATEQGKCVYGKLGFVVEEKYAIPLPLKWAEKTRTEVYLMRRPVTGRGV